LEKQLEPLPQVVATVNGEPLARDLLLQGMQKQRHAVIRYFHRHHAVQPGPDFWKPEERYGGESPWERLLHQSMDNALQTSLLLQLAAANGIVDPDSHSIDADRRAANQQRGEVLAAGGIIYGPRHFTARAFHDHSLALLKIELEALLLQGELRRPHWASPASMVTPITSLEPLLQELRDQAHIIIHLIPAL
jgi:hypothetical protein